MKLDQHVPEIRFKGFTEDWNEIEFSSIATLRRGLTYTPENISTTGVRVLRSSNINEEFFELHEDDVFVDTSAVNIPYVNNGDILITSANGSNRLVGKHTILGGMEPNSMVHGGFMLLASSENPNFVNSLMSSSWYTNFINTYVAGGNGAIGNLNKNDLEHQFVFVPSQKEQIKIGDLFKFIDQTITLYQTKLDKLLKIKEFFLSKLFPKEGSNVPELRFKGFSEPWELRKLNYISDVRDGTHDSPTYQKKGYPFVTSKNVKDGCINFDDIQYISEDDFIAINKRSKVDVHDILMGMIGTIGNIALIRSEPHFAIKNVALIKDTKQINYLYLYHYLQSDNIKNQLVSSMDGGTQKFIALENIRNLLVYTPSLEEQSNIGSFLDKMEILLALHQRKLDKLKLVKSYFLKKMFV